MRNLSENEHATQLHVHFRITLLILTLLALVFAGRTASAGSQAAFTVDSTADAVDASPGDGVCAAASGDCTLRAAIQEANALAGDDVITLPAGVYTLTIAGAGENGAATGDLDLRDNLTLQGSGAGVTIIDGNGGATGDRVLHVHDAVVGSLLNLTVAQGRVTGDGGGMLNRGMLTIQRSRVVGNTATGNGGSGGGISNQGGLTVRDTTISGNTVEGDLDTGGGIFNSGTATILRSTLSNNNGSNAGGGIHMDFGARATITNSTISGNTADFGGGIRVGGRLQLKNVTITANTAYASGGGVYNQGTQFVIGNTIIAGNLSGGAPDCNDLLDILESLGYNLIGNNQFCDFPPGPGDQIGTPADPIDPLLGPLQNNGGPTRTHALLTGSPAIDMGSPTDFPPTDQRGFPRPVDGDGSAISDIGSYEASQP